MKMKNVITKSIIFTASVIMVFSLSGCKEKMFKTAQSKYELTGVNASEMKSETFYVKNGTKFYKVYFPHATFKTGSVTKLSNPSRLFWLGQDESLVPTYYKGELIAYCSNEMNLGTITLERFKDVGYSFGMIDGEYDDEAEFIGYSTKSLIAGTSAATKLSKSKAKDIRLVSIDNTPVNAASVDKAGLITNLSYGKNYEVSYYTGTYYNTETLQADQRYFEGFETFQIKDVSLTKNGFIAIEMPEDAKSGWYMINGQGVFKYYSYEKGTTDISSIEMNEPYYLSEQEQIEEYSQQYLVSIPNKANNISITVTYITDKYEDEEIITKLTSPSGIIYDLTGEDGTLQCMLEEAMAGKWTINVYPRDLVVKDIKVASTDPRQDAVTDSFTYNIDEPQTNVCFYATYKGSDDVWAYVTDELGATTEMTLDKKNRKLYCKYAYLPEGKYTITVYHFADTSVEEGNWGPDTTGEITEIITVTE